MKATNKIETLDEAIEAGAKITAIYTNGERVKFIENTNSGKVEVEFQDGSNGLVDRNDLIDFVWVVEAEEYVLTAEHIRTGDKLIGYFDSWQSGLVAYMGLCNNKGIKDIQQPTSPSVAMDLQTTDNGYKIALSTEKK